MLQELDTLTAKLSNIEKRLKSFGLRINDKISLSKIRDGYISISKYVKNINDLEKATISLCGSLQKIERLDIDLNEHDLWFVAGYKTDLKADYEYKALLRTASKNGYPTFVRFEYILKDEKFATYDDEKGIIRVDYRDEGRDKSITLENMEEKFRLFFCLLDIRNKKGGLLHQIKVPMTPKEVLEIKKSSPSKDSYEGRRWCNKKKGWVPETKYSVWHKFSKQMIQKTLVKQGFRMLRETIPSLGEFFEFEEQEDEYNVGKSAKTQNIKDEEPKWVITNADLDNPTDELKIEISQTIEEYKSSPIMKEQNKAKILAGLGLCKEIKDYQDFVNTFIIQILSLEDKELMKTIKAKETEITSKKIVKLEKEKEEKKDVEKKEIQKPTPKIEPKVNPKPLPNNINITKGVPKGLNKDKLDKDKDDIFKKLKSDLESCEGLDQLRQCFENHLFKVDFAKLDKDRKAFIINTKNDMKEILK